MSDVPSQVDSRRISGSSVSEKSTNSSFETAVQSVGEESDDQCFGSFDEGLPSAKRKEKLKCPLKYLLLSESDLCSAEEAPAKYAACKVRNARVLSDDVIDAAQEYFVRVSDDGRTKTKQEIFDVHETVFKNYFCRKTLDESYYIEDATTDTRLRAKNTKKPLLRPTEVHQMILEVFKDENGASLTILALEDKVREKGVHIIAESLRCLFPHPSLKPRQRGKQNGTLALLPAVPQNQNFNEDGTLAPNPSVNQQLVLAKNIADQVGKALKHSDEGAQPQITINIDQSDRSDRRVGSIVNNNKVYGAGTNYQGGGQGVLVDEDFKKIEELVAQGLKPGIEEIQRTVKKPAQPNAGNENMHSSPKTPSNRLEERLANRKTPDLNQQLGQDDKQDSPDEVHSDFPSQPKKVSTLRNLFETNFWAIGSKFSGTVPITDEQILNQQVSNIGIACLGNKSSSSGVAMEDYGNLGDLLNAVKSHCGSDSNKLIFRLYGTSINLFGNSTAEEKMAKPEIQIKHVEHECLELVVMKITSEKDITWSKIPNVVLINACEPDIRLSNDVPKSIADLGIFWKDIGSCAYLTHQEDSQKKLKKLSTDLQKEFGSDSLTEPLTQARFLFPGHGINSAWPIQRSGGGIKVGNIYFDGKYEINGDIANASDEYCDKKITDIIKESGRDPSDHEQIKVEMDELLAKRGDDVREVHNILQKSGDLPPILKSLSEAYVIRIFPRDLMPDIKPEACVQGIGDGPKPSAFIDCRVSPLQVTMIDRPNEKVESSPTIVKKENDPSVKKIDPVHEKVDYNGSFANKEHDSSVKMIDPINEKVESNANVANKENDSSNKENDSSVTMIDPSKEQVDCNYTVVNQGNDPLVTKSDPSNNKVDCKSATVKKEDDPSATMIDQFDQKLHGSATVLNKENDPVATIIDLSNEEENPTITNKESESFPCQQGLTANDKNASSSNTTYIPDPKYVVSCQNFDKLMKGVWYRKNPDGLAVLIPSNSKGSPCQKCSHSCKEGKYCGYHKNFVPSGEALEYWSKKV